MPYESAQQAVPAPLRYRDAILYPPAVPEPRMLPAEIPPGVQYVTLPNGTRTLAYTHPDVATVLPPAVQPVPAWAKTTALLAPTVGGGIGAAGIGISYAAPGLLAMAEALWALVALIAAGTALPLILRTGRSRAHRGGPVQHVTQHVTATGLFGRATGTINHR
ncbi:hypothetical protein ACXNSR_17685 [Streptomyces sp. NC-S4]